MREIGKILGGKRVKAGVGKKESITDAKLDWEPLKVDVGGVDVLPGFGASLDSSYACQGSCKEPQTRLHCSCPAEIKSWIRVSTTKSDSEGRSQEMFSR